MNAQTPFQTHKFRIGALTVTILPGDVTLVKADALITGINSVRMWFGGVDGAIQRVAGMTYHAQAERADLSKEGDTVIAKETAPHAGGFHDVVFVVDDLEGPLSTIVLSALNAASKSGYRHVTMPPIRMGVAKKPVDESVLQIIDALKAFSPSEMSSLTHVTIVVYNQPNIVSAFCEALSPTHA